MYRSFAFAMGIMMLAVGLAGCIGSEDPPAPTDESGIQAAPTERTGSIEGQIVTIDLEPVAEAEAILIDGQGQAVMKAPTDEEGRFVMNDITPGDYKLQVIARCCKSKIESVTVEAKAVEEVSLQLQKLSSADLEEPHVRDNVWEGFISCGVGGGVPGVRNPKLAACAVPGVIHESVEDPNEEFIIYFNMSKGLETIVVGMDWQPVGGISGQKFNLLLENGTCREIGCSDAYRYADLDGPPRLQARIDKEDIDPEAVGARFEDFKEEEEMKFRVFVGDGYAEIVYQQPFTVYWYEFYYEPAPEGFNPFPEG